MSVRWPGKVTRSVSPRCCACVRPKKPFLAGLRASHNDAVGERVAGGDLCHHFQKIQLAFQQEMRPGIMMIFLSSS